MTRRIIVAAALSVGLLGGGVGAAEACVGASHETVSASHVTKHHHGHKRHHRGHKPPKARPGVIVITPHCNRLFPERPCAL